MTWITGTGDGSDFAPAESANYFFERLRAETVGLRAGFRVVNTSAAQLNIPRVVSDAAVSWTGEAEEITPSTPGTDTVTAVPRKLAALVYASNELVSDSNPDAQDVLAENLARATALKLDHGFFEGSGVAPEITGLRHQDDIQTHSMGDDGAPLANLDPFAEAIGLLAEANANATAIIMHPRNWRALIQIKEDSGTSLKPLLQDSAGSGAQEITRSIYGVPVFLTSQLSTDEVQGEADDANSIYVIDAPQVVAVMRSDVRIDVDRSAAFSSDSTAVRVTMRADLVLPNPEAVVRITGVIHPE